MLKFEFGHTVITAQAFNELEEDDILNALERYYGKDWGDVHEEDKKSNDDALEEGNRIIGSYKSEKGIPFWIITEADRSRTTILLPSEY